MEILEKLKELEYNANNKNYYKIIVEQEVNEIDIEINKVIEELSKLPIKKREAIISNFKVSYAWILIAHSINMVTHANRCKCQKYFDDGLLALSAAKHLLDVRDVLVVMALFYDTHINSQLTFDNIINKTDEFSEFIVSFINRDEKNKTLKCMGYHIEKDDSGNMYYLKN